MNDLSKQLQDMREEYENTPLRKKDLKECPFSQFSEWLQDARDKQIADPNACSLATVDENNKPMARAVLLKGMENEKFTFYTNYNSRKAKHMDITPFATMHFPWFSMERQVVVFGRVQKLDEDQSDKYFQSRPLNSRLGAWASMQSEPLDSRETLEKAFIKALEDRGEQPPKPPHWGGYALEPESIEFWQGGPSRLHDRFIYQRNSSDDWLVNRFFP